MPAAKPKRRTSDRSKTKEVENDESWRSEIEELSLNDERWTCVIAMIVEARVEHARYLELFNEAAETETRESVFALSYDKLIRATKSLGKQEPRQGLCRFANQLITESSETALTPWLLCMLIKFFVNRAKTRYSDIAGRRARIEGEVAKEVANMRTTTKTGGPSDTVSKSKGGSGDAKAFEKVNTMLRRRGEEWRDKVCVDDAPIDGPNLYVVLSGFYDPSLPMELLNNGLPLIAIFEMASHSQPGKELVESEQVRTFWSTLNASLKHPETASLYRGVVRQTFCPPEPQESVFEDDEESLKSDAYRRVSFLMYDLCDIVRQHASYIENMKLQSGLDEVRPEVMVTETYDAIMNLIPEECASIPILLDALLSQVVGIASPRSESKGTTPDERKILGRFEDRLKSKIDHLDREFDVLSGKEMIEENSEALLIVHGDTLRCNVHQWYQKLADVLEGDFMDFGIRVQRQSVVNSLWHEVPVLTVDRTQMYSYHIHEMSNCFDSKTDIATTLHYLHLLVFQTMINGDSPQTDPRESEDHERRLSSPSVEELRVEQEKRTTSQAANCNQLDQSSPPSVPSDSNIEYKNSAMDTLECPELVDLIDTREMLTSDHPSTSTESLDLREFDSVQLLSVDVFSQLFFECSQQFSLLETRYFPPTDSVLVCFRNQCTRDNITERRYAASIPTPVCLRDFNTFVVDEVKEWIAKQDEMHARRSNDAEALRKKQTLESEQPATALYTDEDFILPNSIKATEARKQKSSHTLSKDRNESLLPDAGKSSLKGGKETQASNPKKARKSKLSVEAINHTSDDHKSDQSPTATNVTTSPILEKTVGDDEDFSFIGYDVANCRIQVSERTSEFRSEDGTLVRATLEEWTYAEASLRVNVELFGNSLVLHTGESPTIRFTAANGIVMGLPVPVKTSDLETSSGSIERNVSQGGSVTSNDQRLPETAVGPGFAASWPTGLIIETLPGDGSPSNPFYIKQSRRSKGLKYGGSFDESRRVYLRDGTIVVFSDDDGVRVLCSNGTIVTCNEFPTPEIKQPDLKRLESAERKRNEKGGFPSDKVSRMKSRSGTRVALDDKVKRKSRESFLSLDEPTKNCQEIKMIRTVVLDPDGRRYEVCNGEVVRELDQELVRTSSDYEVDEKLTRRSDGTDILINSEGSLAVRFPDGSRITTGYVIENDPVFCEWTQEELDSFYPPTDDNEASTENIPREDGFVSIFLTCCMEHENYARVTYDQSKANCTLSMPGDVKIDFRTNGTFDVAVGSDVSLKVDGAEITFLGRMGKQLDDLSVSVCSLECNSGSRPLLRTTDSLGNVFTVDFDGKTKYESFRGNNHLREEVAVEHNEENEEQLNVRKSSSGLDPRDYRLFVVKRDLTAYEHLHRSERKLWEEKAHNDETTAIFGHQISEQPGQKLYTTLSVLNPITTTERWLQSYRVSSIQPRNADRRDLPRSTYSLPWDYLIPYGRNGLGINRNTWHLGLKNRTNASSPKILLARTIHTIHDCDANVSKRLQEALQRYSEKAINHFNEYQGFVPRTSSLHDEHDIREWLYDFALGRRKSFDKTLYFSGLARKSSPTLEGDPRPSRGQRRREDEVATEDIEWYKNCLRNHVVPPYFVNVPGACFLWILDSAEKIVYPKFERGTADDISKKRIRNGTGAKE